MGGIEWRRAHGKRRAPTESRRTCVLPDEKQYQSLVRLAALLTGDAELAETVTAEALVTAPGQTARLRDSEHCFAALQRQVVERSRHGRDRPASEQQGPADQPGREAAAGRERETPAGGDPSARRGAPAPTEFGRLPVIAALRRLPQHVREAVVLTYYLDLPPAEVAAIAGVSAAALHESLAAAMVLLDDQDTGPWLSS